MLTDTDVSRLEGSSLRRVETSKKAAENDPRTNKNYRCNPSVLIKYHNSKNILIDCGKTFRESAVRWFPVHGVHSIDSVILTHGHADAIFGIDDLRSTQPPKGAAPLAVYQSIECEAVTRRAFKYLYPKRTVDPNAVARFVANIDWQRMEPYIPFTTNELEILPVPVMPGEDMTCMGFLFGKKQKVCYLSDISRMLPETLEKIKQFGEIDVLVIDALLPPTATHATHYNLAEAIELIKIIRPKKAYAIGMSASIEHDSTNAYLKTFLESDQLDIELSYDGLKLTLDL
jgi:phosphoribosyl 1,2-cyclic phosphodiesterase